MNKVLVPLADMSQIKVDSVVVYKDANKLSATCQPVILTETGQYMSGYLFLFWSLYYWTNSCSALTESVLPQMEME